MMLTVTSCIEFWSNKWNLLVHDVLKHGIYKPTMMYTNGNKFLGCIATFIASGLFHDWLLSFMSITIKNDKDDDGDDDDVNVIQNNTSKPMIPTYGPGFCFFLWQAMIVSIEYYILQLTTTTTKTKEKGNNNNNGGGMMLGKICNLYAMLPKMIRATFVIMVGIPIAHWFLRPYVESDFFVHGNYALPMIIRLDV